MWDEVFVGVHIAMRRWLINVDMLFLSAGMYWMHGMMGLLLVRADGYSSSPLLCTTAATVDSGGADSALSVDARACDPPSVFLHFSQILLLCPLYPYSLLPIDAFRFALPTLEDFGHFAVDDVETGGMNPGPTEIASDREAVVIGESADTINSF